MTSNNKHFKNVMNIMLLPFKVSFTAKMFDNGILLQEKRKQLFLCKLQMRNKTEDII